MSCKNQCAYTCQSLRRTRWKKFAKILLQKESHWQQCIKPVTHCATKVLSYFVWRLAIHHKTHSHKLSPQFVTQPKLLLLTQILLCLQLPSFLIHYTTMKMEEVYSSETLANFYQTAQRQIPENIFLHRRRCGHLKYTEIESVLCNEVLVLYCI